MRRVECRHGVAGFMLAEVLLSLALLGVVTAALSTAFLGMVRLYREEVAVLELLAQARFAAQSLLRDITYAQFVRIDEEQIAVFTQRNASSLQKIVYKLDKKKKEWRIMKEGQPLTGESKSARVSFSEMHFTQRERGVICVELTAVDLDSGRKISLETAAFMQNWREDADAGA